MYKSTDNAYIINALDNIFTADQKEREETKNNVMDLCNGFESANRAICNIKNILKNDVALQAKFETFLIDANINFGKLRDNIALCEKYMYLSNQIEDIRQLLCDLD